MVIADPVAIVPLRVETLTGARPESAIGTPFSPVGPLLPITFAGRVETTPRNEELVGPAAFLTPP